MARTTSFTGQTDPVRFPVVLVNEGNAWQTTSHRAIVPRRGYYFLHIGGGIHTYRAMRLNIFVNNVRIMSTGRSSATLNNGIDMTSRGGVLHLNAGSELKITCTYSTGAYSDQMMQTIFIGLLL